MRQTDAETYICAGVVPCRLPILEPAALPSDCAEEAHGSMPPEEEAASRLLSFASEAVSRWYLLMRGAILREKRRQAAYREENGLPQSYKVEYVRPALTAAEGAEVMVIRALVDATFGTRVAEYAMDCFRKAIATGDKRSFKIRLVMLKCRDALAGTTFHQAFCDAVEDFTSYAEYMAGCTPDPSPRRMSRAEQERSRIREARAREASRFQQMELFDPNASGPVSIYSEEPPAVVVRNNPAPIQVILPENAPSLQDIDVQDIERQMVPTKGGYRVSVDEQSPLEEPNTSVLKTPENVISENDIVQEVVNSDKLQVGVDFSKFESVSTEVTVTKPPETQEVTVTKISGNNAPNDASGQVQKPIRKTRTYTSASEISADIAAGLIVPYSNNAEVIADMKAGDISPVEAVVFLAELGKRNRPSPSAADDKTKLSRDADKKLERMAVVDVDELGKPVDAEEVEDVEEMDDDEDLDDAQDRGEGGWPSERGDFGAFSAANYNASGAEFCPEDNW